MTARDATRREWIEIAGFEIRPHELGGYVAMRGEQGAWGQDIGELWARIQTLKKG